MEKLGDTKTMKDLLLRLEQKIEKIDPALFSKNKCWRCRDTGVRMIAIDGSQKAANCLCVRRESAQSQLNAVPTLFRKVCRLNRLEPRLALHRNQKPAVMLIKSKPHGSYLLLGKNGTGKTHLAWCLYRHAVNEHRSVVACRARDLIADFRRLEIGVSGEEVLKTPRVTSDDLARARKPWFVFLDEFEKARPSEFAAEMLFNVLDAVKSYRHQLVVCSNFDVEQLRDHWGRIDPIWGNSIMTRLQMCSKIKFF